MIDVISMKSICLHTSVAWRVNFCATGNVESISVGVLEDGGVLAFKVRPIAPWKTPRPSWRDTAWVISVTLQSVRWHVGGRCGPLRQRLHGAWWLAAPGEEVTPVAGEVAERSWLANGS